MSCKSVNVLILSAGFGTRLQPIIGDLPKPLVDLCGRKALQIAIEAFDELDFVKKIYINVHWQAQKIKDFINSLDHKKPIELVEEKELLETGGGIMNVMNMMEDRFLMVKNADAIFISSRNIYQEMIKYFYELDTDALLLLTDDLGYRANGDFSIIDKNRIYRDYKNSYIYTGCSIFSREFFNECSEAKAFPLSNLLFLSNKNNYKNYKYHGMTIATNKTLWFDIGTPSNLEIARLEIYRNPDKFVL
jgi:NDP-sugar pyrophosphorylase family protein